MSKRLLIVACSGRKHPKNGPAVEVYDGVNFRVIHRMTSSGSFPDDVDTMVISAKYGLIRASTPIEPYDLKLTPERAKELTELVSNQMEELQLATYNRVLINAGRLYVSLITWALSPPWLPETWSVAQGGIGSKMRHMKDWLQS